MYHLGLSIYVARSPSNKSAKTLEEYLLWLQKRDPLHGYHRQQATECETLSSEWKYPVPSSDLLCRSLLLKWRCA